MKLLVPVVSTIESKLVPVSSGWYSISNLSAINSVTTLFVNVDMEHCKYFSICMHLFHASNNPNLTDIIHLRCQCVKPFLNITSGELQIQPIFGTDVYTKRNSMNCRECIWAIWLKIEIKFMMMWLKIEIFVFSSLFLSVWKNERETSRICQLSWTKSKTNDGRFERSNTLAKSNWTNFQCAMQTEW